MSFDNPEGSESRRKFTRKYTMFKIPAYDAETKRFLGLVQDLSEHGIQLLILAADYVKGGPISFEAVCRWVRKEDPQGYYASGFEIVDISEETRKNLISLMEYVTLD